MKILFIGARLFDDVAFYAKKQGIISILTESNNKAPNLKLADHYYIVSRGMREPKEIALNEDVDAVIPLIGVDDPLIEVAKMKEELENSYDLPVIASGLETVKTTIDKLKTKEFFIRNGIKTPPFNVISKKNKFDGPVVLKQLKGQGGYGIKIASNKFDFENYFTEFDEAIEEEYIEGYELSIEVLRWNKELLPLELVNKGKTTLEGIHPLDKLRYAPAEIDGLDNKRIRSLSGKIADLLRAEGNIDIDLIVNDNSGEIFVTEINTRPSGTRYLTNASTDVNPMHELVNMATGKWNVKKIEKRMKKYFALEIPVKSFQTANNKLKIKDFPNKNSWIIHGPKNFQRITIRAENRENAIKIITELNLEIPEILKT
jgi:carbamoylphosphate synthase large subunit